MSVYMVGVWLVVEEAKWKGGTGGGDGEGRDVKWGVGKVY